MDSNGYDLKVGDSAARLIANVDFEVFIEEVRRRRELILSHSMEVACDSYDEYRSAQGEYKALTEIIGMPALLAETARDIREHENE